MSIMTRFVRLFKADVHGVMDQLEDKKLLLRQYLREMEKSLGQKEAQVRALSDRMDRLTAYTQRQTQEITKINQDVDLALSMRKDDIARMLIRRRLETEATAGHLEEQIENASREKSRLLDTIRDQRLQYETFKARADTWQQQGGNEPFASAAHTFTGVDDSTQIRDEEIELELIRRKKTLAKEGAA